MSLVGTRPPTVDEWDKYELHHRARLATKPGLTGMWQVIGRSNITDFEERIIICCEYLGHAPFGHQGEDVIKKLTQKYLEKDFWHEQNGVYFVDDVELLED